MFFISLVVQTNETTNQTANKRNKTKTNPKQTKAGRKEKTTETNKTKQEIAPFAATNAKEAR